MNLYVPSNSNSADLLRLVHIHTPLNVMPAYASLIYMPELQVV